jgi:hypothetical protein
MQEGLSGLHWLGGIELVINWTKKGEIKQKKKDGLVYNFYINIGTLQIIYIKKIIGHVLIKWMRIL